MKDIKKIMITLVALLAVTTGAWAADYLYLEVDGTSATVKYGADKGTNPYYGDNPMSPGNYGWYVAMDEHMPDKVTSYSGKNTLTTVTIDASCQNYTGTTLESLFDYCSVLTTINNLENLNTSEVTNMKRMFKMCTALTSLDLSGWNTAKVTNMYEMFYGSASSGSALETLDLSGWNTSSVTDMRYMFQNCTTLKNIYVGDGWSTASVTTDTKMFDKCTNLPNWDGTIDKTNAHTGDGGYLKVKPAAPSGPTVAWNKTSKTGSFDMPGGNVELEPEYYPQAAFATGGAPTAINDVPATTDGAIVKAGTVANIGSTTTAQGTVMYYVSKTEMTDAALLALAADKWTADVPTAETFTAAGQAYVYYYVRGNDSDTDDENFSDGDILSANALTVTIAAEPTYAVTFAEGTDPNEWTASPAAGVTKGTPVTVTYSGSKKVIGVKAEKKAGDTGKSLAEATVGMIIGSNGKAYAADDKDNLPEGVTAVAKVCYVDGTGHGLALALTDEVEEMNWSTAQTTCAAHTPAITGGTWKLASKDEWNNMITAAGSHTALRDGFSSVGGTNMQSDFYWSSTTISYGAWYYTFDGGSWSNGGKGATQYVRACLAF